MGGGCSLTRDFERKKRFCFIRGSRSEGTPGDVEKKDLETGISLLRSHAGEPVGGLV